MDLQLVREPFGLRWREEVVEHFAEIMAFAKSDYLYEVVYSEGLSDQKTSMEG